MLLISTCGTSLLTHDLSADERNKFARLANKKEQDLSREEKKYLDRHAADCGEKLLQASLEQARKMSAEINGIAAVYAGQLPQGTSNRHIFLHSDTYMGALSVEMLMRWAQNNGLNNESKTFPGLHTASLESFRPAMSEAARWCCEEIAPQRSTRDRIVFNLTGGFKSVQGFMQTLGMFYADEVVYIFEGSTELLRIPRLPLSIEAATMQIIGENVVLFRKMAAGIPLDKETCRDIPETLLDAYGPNAYALSPWGEIFWHRYKEAYYGKAFIQESPLPEKISFSKGFLADVRQFENNPQKLAELNERIDDLTQYFLGNTISIKRLNFKLLEGNPVPGCTHEFYAWRTGGAWRCFCVFDEYKKDLCHIKKLGPHLK
ncbi:MAG: hypothetical protein LBD82_04715 [Deltaproteobacteria bacterium]|jgi:putative CRISPR-associated protein (TIGR02619 family)|nr:hypothetical protein [Deltaproteobacteria bacterium]